MGNNSFVDDAATAKARRSRSLPRRNIRLWRYYAAAKVRGELQYRASFAFGLVAQSLATAIDVVALWAIFHTTRTVGGWQARQVMWLYAVSMTAFGLADLLVSAIEELPEHIRTGRFDSYLLRPTRVLPTVIADGFELRRAGRAIPGLVCLILLSAKPTLFGLHTTVLSVGWTYATVFLGMWIYGSLFILMNSIAFWLIDGREVANAFTYGGSAASHYPLDILVGWLRHLFIWVVPVGFVAWLPGTRLLDVPKPNGLAPWVALCGPIVAVAMTALAALVWSAGLRRYESTGS